MRRTSNSSSTFIATKLWLAAGMLARRPYLFSHCRHATPRSLSHLLILIILGSQVLACSRIESNRRHREQAATNNNNNANQSGNGNSKGDESDAVGANEGHGSQANGQAVQLSAIAPQKKFLSPIILARSLGQTFSISWRAPNNCESINESLWDCSGASAPYCLQANREITKLYCKLGGNSREARSYLGASFTTGDLVLLWGTAVNLCKYRDDTSNMATFTRLGISVNRDKLAAAQSLVDRFLGSMSPSDKAKEVSFVMDNFFRPADDPGQAQFVEGDKAELHRKFTAACLYLTMHEQQIIY